MNFFFPDTTPDPSYVLLVLCLISIAIPVMLTDTCSFKYIYYLLLLDAPQGQQQFPELSLLPNRYSTKFLEKLGLKTTSSVQSSG